VTTEIQDLLLERIIDRKEAIERGQDGRAKVLENEIKELKREKHGWGHWAGWFAQTPGCEEETAGEEGGCGKQANHRLPQIRNLAIASLFNRGLRPQFYISEYGRQRGT
jgi:hypothetical protein